MQSTFYCELHLNLERLYHAPYILNTFGFNDPVNAIKVMSNRSVYLTALFPGQAQSSKQVFSTCAY